MHSPIPLTAISAMMSNTAHPSPMPTQISQPRCVILAAATTSPTEAPFSVQITSSLLEHPPDLAKAMLITARTTAAAPNQIDLDVIGGCIGNRHQ